MDSLKLEIKQLLIEALDLEDLRPEDIDDDAPLFDTDGVGLDSIDALQILVAIEQEFNIEIPQEEAPLRSVKTIAAYIDAQGGSNGG